MLQNDILVQLTAKSLPMPAQWFMQDGAMLHTANVMLDFLNTVFGTRIMLNCCPDHHNCGNSWPSLSPDLNPCDFFLWGFLKEMMIWQKPVNLRWDKCLLSYAKGLKKTYRHVIMNTCHGLQEVTGQYGGHMKHILTEKMYTGVWTKCVKLVDDKQHTHFL